MKFFQSNDVFKGLKSPLCFCRCTYTRPRHSIPTDLFVQLSHENYCGYFTLGRFAFLIFCSPFLQFIPNFCKILKDINSIVFSTRMFRKIYSLSLKYQFQRVQLLNKHLCFFFNAEMPAFFLTYRNWTLIESAHDSLTLYIN